MRPHPNIMDNVLLSGSERVVKGLNVHAAQSVSDSPASLPY